MFGGFGTTAAAPAGASTPAGGFSFGTPGGNKPATTTTGFGGFGLNSSASKPPTTTGGFGFGSTATTASPAPALGGATTGGFGFGGTQATTTTGFGSFGSPNPSNQPQTQAAPSMFGQSAAQRPTGNAFQMPQPTAGSTWGMPIAHQQTTSQQNQSNLSIFHEPIKEMKKRYAPYIDGFGNPHLTPSDPSCRPNQDCKFSSINYRKYDDINNPPSQLMDMPRGEDIDSYNPDAEKYFAVREYGINTLQIRYDNQTKMIDNDNNNIIKLHDIVESVDIKINHMISRYDGLKSNFSHLQLQLLRILRKIELLRNRSVPLQSAEIKYREHLEKLVLAIQEPSKKLQELLLLESQVNHRSDSFVDTVSEEDMVTLYNLLEKQRQGIEILADVLTKDVRDVDIISNTLQKSSRSHP